MGVYVEKGAGRDPREEKRRNFRHAGHCRRARCGVCHPSKRWGDAAGDPRTLRERAAAAEVAEALR